MKLELSTWTHHLNHLLYSYFYYCENRKEQLNIIFNSKITHNGAVLYVKGLSLFFDYSDDPKFIDLPERYNYYFKRSLQMDKKEANIFPLNFNVPMSYKCHSFLFKLKKEFLLYKPNRREVIKAIDRFGLFTNSSHGILDVRKYPEKVIDNGGKIIFYTRLWNPDNNTDVKEQERRRLQNDFRINACRIIKKEFKNASVGLFSDGLSTKLAPDLILSSNESNKKNYLKNLNNFNIGIADDGLKNTPGWKIGEYLLNGKALISTPLNVMIEDFDEHVNYERLSSRSSFEELPEKIEGLIKNKGYLEMGENNFHWSQKYLHPSNYLNRILLLVENKETAK